MTAQFFEGVIGATPMEEWLRRDDLGQHNSTLRRICRAGYVVTRWQSGKALDSTGAARRALVEGLCTDRAVENIRFGLDLTDLVVIAHPPGACAWDAFITVAVEAGEYHSRVGAIDSPEALIKLWSPACSHEAVTDVLDAWQVTVVDPTWGRDDELWTRLAAALEWS